MNGFRFLDTGAMDAFENMAMDEAILEAFEPERASPALRLYQWSERSLSIGRFQNSGQINWDGCRACHVRVVRRPTGGTALLHQDELTYSFIASANDYPSSFLESYYHINEAVRHALKRLGIATERGRRGELQAGPACFFSSSTGDLTHRGKKIVACAQLRRHGVLLQHGSLVISHDPGLLTSILHLDLPMDQASARAAFGSRVMSLSECMGSGGASVDVKLLKDSLVRSFEDRLCMEAVPDKPGAIEMSIYRDLLKRKYTRSKWNLEGIWDGNA